MTTSNRITIAERNVQHVTKAVLQAQLRNAGIAFADKDTVAQLRTKVREAIKAQNDGPQVEVQTRKLVVLHGKGCDNEGHHAVAFETVDGEKIRVFGDADETDEGDERLHITLADLKAVVAALEA